MKPQCSQNQYVTREMAKHAYAAVAVQYPQISNVDDRFEEKARAVADSTNAHSAISMLLAHEKVDASVGIAVGGYSQGTHIAVLAAKFNHGISAAFLQSGGRPLVEGTFEICDSVNLPDHLPQSKRRYITGEADQYYAWPTPWVDETTPSCAAAIRNLQLASGYCNCDQANGLQPDGSGFYVLQQVDTGTTTVPDHGNWMGGNDGGVSDWYNDKAKQWSFASSLQWLATAARRDAEVN